MRDDERKKENPSDIAKNAATGYAVVVLGILCFVVALAVVTLAVRLVVGASAAGALATTAAGA